MSEEKRELSLDEMERAAGGAGGSSGKCPLGTHTLKTLPYYDGGTKELFNKVSGCDMDLRVCTTCMHLVFYLSGTEVSTETFYSSVKDLKHTKALLYSYFPAYRH